MGYRWDLREEKNQVFPEWEAGVRSLYEREQGRQDKRQKDSRLHIPREECRGKKIQPTLTPLSA